MGTQLQDGSRIGGSRAGLVNSCIRKGETADEVLSLSRESGGGRLPGCPTLNESDAGTHPAQIDAHG